MVFLAEQTIPVPHKDINSWIFDEVSYDQDQPVSNPTPSISGIEHFDVSYATAESFIVEDLHRCHQPQEDNICQAGAHNASETCSWPERMGSPA